MISPDQLLRVRWLLAIASVTLGSCFSPPRPLRWSDAVGVPEPPLVPRETDAVACEPVAKLHALTEELVGSYEFRSYLGRIEHLAPKLWSDRLTGEAVSEIYAGLDPRYQRARIVYVLGSATGDVTASTGLAGGVATITLQPATIKRADATGIPEQQACAANTFAHEWTHAIGDQRGGYVFSDDGFKVSRFALVSYTVGSLAQCVLLKRHYPTLHIPACVEAVGTKGFASCTCEPGWGATLRCDPQARPRATTVPPKNRNPHHADDSIRRPASP